MFSKIALSLALVLATASGAMAATKHQVHGKQAAVAKRVPAAAYQAQALDAAPIGKSPSKLYGVVGTPAAVEQPLAFRIQSYAP
jgi:hypothetical protein